MESRNDIATQLCVACLGAGVITTMAVAQGQSPLTALGITLFSGIAALIEHGFRGVEVRLLISPNCS